MKRGMEEVNEGRRKEVRVESRKKKKRKKLGSEGERRGAEEMTKKGPPLSGGEGSLEAPHLQFYQGCFPLLPVDHSCLLLTVSTIHTHTDTASTFTTAIYHHGGRGDEGFR